MGLAEARFYGYGRENGEVGVRNHVAVLAVDGLCNAAVDGVARLIRGTVPVTHPYGRLQFGADLDLTFRTLIGIGSNPNVAAALVVGFEPVWTGVVSEGIAKAGKPVESVVLHGHGILKAVEEGARKARGLVLDASELRREPFNPSKLRVSIKCGASDTTSGIASNPSVGVAVDRLIDLGATVLFGESTELAGAEHIIARRAVNDDVRREFLEVVRGYVDFAVSKGVDILGSQPTQENIAGGLTTIEEKALGNIQKTGTKPILGVLKPAQQPTGPRGLYFMNTSSSAQEAVTLFAAAGAQLHIFSTGQGNPVGNPVEPVIKVTGNPKTASTMAEHIDVDVSGILTETLSLREAGDLVFREVLKVASGKLTSAEVLHHTEFAPTRLYESM